MTGEGTVPIRELVAFSVGGGWGKEDEFADSEFVAVIRGADFPDAELGVIDGLPRRWEARRKISSRLLEPGDILIEASGGTDDRPTGRTVFISAALLGAAGLPVIPASFCRLVRVDRSKADPRYVYYWLQAMYAAGRTWEYQNRSTGISNFQFNYFLDAERVRLPSVGEQSAIADALESIDKKMQSNLRIERRADALCAAVAEVCIAEGDAADAPLGDVATFNDDAVRPGSTEALRYIDIASVSCGAIDCVQHMTWSEAPSRARRGVSDGDVIFSTVRPGRRAYAQVLDPAPDTVASTGFAVIRPRRVGSSFLTYIAGHPSFGEYLQAVAHGSAYPAVSIDAMSKYVMPLPGDEALKDFERKTMPLRRRAACARRETQLLTRARSALIRDLTSGVLAIRHGRLVEGLAQ